MSEPADDGEPLRVLLIEGSAEDADLLERQLRRGGFDPAVTRVDDEPTLRLALDEGGWQVVLADYWLPTFSGLDALRIVQGTGLDIPFILIASQLGQAEAAHAMRVGAHDYLSKDRLARLAPVIVRELREATGRRDRAAAEAAALKESERRLVAVLDAAPTAMVGLDSSGTIVLVNRLAETTFGYGHGRMIGQPFSTIVPAHFTGVHDTVRAVWDGAEMAAGATTGLDILARRSGGAEFPVDITQSRVDMPDGAALAVIAVHDLTERRALEERLRELSKMDAVGRLAGGIAHDFNNLLTVIGGFAELVLNDTPHNTPQRTAIAEIVKASERATTLTRQLLAFSRRQVLAPDVVDLDDLVADLAPMLDRLLGEDVRLVHHRSSGPVDVLADRGHLEQVVMNLAVNARDAMPAGGRLEIEVTPTTVDAVPAGSPLRPGRCALLQVTDSGVGMEPETLAHIFEPFFTTKADGTGLGLATVYGVVAQSGGQVEVESVPGVGTTFRVLLPATDRQRTRVEATPNGDRPGVEATRGRAECLLVVEDEAGVRELTCTVLERAGYVVLEASEPETALAFSQDPDRRIDMLLTDVVLRQGSGPALAQQLGRQRPGLPVLFMSGYTSDSRLADLPPGSIDLLQKPFTPNELLFRIREILDRSPAAARPERKVGR